jgi:hypothetical protein
MTVVYDGGRQIHLNSETLYAYVKALDKTNQDLNSVNDINDVAAQSIAAMWHSPYGESTFLSTRGMVTEDMTIKDFCTDREYSGLSLDDSLLVDYLDSYIQSKQ